MTMQEINKLLDTAMTKADTCVICLGEIEVQSNGWAGGHNAMPVAEGQCCDDCHGQVMAERFRR